MKAVNRAAEILEINNREPLHEANIANQGPGHLLVKSGTDMYNISLEEILFVEGAQNYVFIHTKEKRIMSLMRMKEIELKLPNQQFFRIHKSFIISLKQIEKIESYQVTIKDYKIPIGKIYKEAFLRKIRVDLN